VAAEKAQLISAREAYTTFQLKEEDAIFGASSCLALPCLVLSCLVWSGLVLACVCLPGGCHVAFSSIRLNRQTGRQTATAAAAASLPSASRSHTQSAPVFCLRPVPEQRALPLTAAATWLPLTASSLTHIITEAAQRRDLNRAKKKMEEERTVSGQYRSI
jgi:hypothetical protein